MLGQVSAPPLAAASSITKEEMFTFRWKIPIHKQQPKDNKQNSKSQRCEVQQ
jgi:hypothetical protein